MTVLEAIQRSGEFLSRKGVDSARLQAELLLAHVLQCERMQLYLNFEQALSESQTAEMRQLVQRRGQREPLQQILGSTSFCGFEIKVNREVLVPRPETELLAEMGWTWLLEKARQEAGGSTDATLLRALDFGTGSGCIAIALARKCPEAKITAVDRSGEALKVAGENVKVNEVSDQVQLLQLDELAALEGPERYHLLISNPPYIPSDEILTLQPEVRDYEPREALEGGPDGLQFYRMLAGEARRLVVAGGKMMLEMGDGQGAAIADLLREQNWIVEALRTDYTGRERMVVATRP